jgi:dephospho-CoA kinase
MTRPLTRPLTIGLTGNIATGKSTVLAWLQSHGAAVIDADKLTHQALTPGGPAYAAVIDAFGPAIVQMDGAIDRKALGEIVFADPAALATLEALVHPAVFTLAQAILRETLAPVVVIEAIKLLESGRLLPLCDEVWVVIADEATQIARLMQTRGMSEAAARQRMAAQSPQAEKVKQATRVIENNGDPDELYTQLARLWRELLAPPQSALDSTQDSTLDSAQGG